MAEKGSKTDPENDIPMIHFGIGQDYLQQIFKGKSWIKCLIELLKNCRDWGATQIMIQTAERGVLRIVDNGCGMDAANRTAFASLNRTTATRDDQSGKFDSGTKHMAYAFARRVEVITAPETEPKWVFRFGFNVSDYERMAREEATVKPERSPKSPAAWPYEFPYGTQLTYFLANPGSGNVRRGAALVRELSGRLPMKFGQIIRVDGETIPPKPVTGEPFELVEQHPLLGEVAVELANPAKRITEDALRIGIAEIGEVRMLDFFGALSPELQQLFPTTYLRPEVCGTIVCPSLMKKYINEDRATVSPDIGEDPRTIHLLHFLRKVEANVVQHLRIQQAAEVSTDDVEIREFMERVNRRYNPEGKVPKFFDEVVTDPDDNGGKPGKPSRRRPKHETAPLRLIIDRHEFAVGETIEVRAILNHATYTLKDVHWALENARAARKSRTGDTVQVVAEEIGPGIIQADIPRSSIAATVEYEVVAARHLRLAPPAAQIKIGSEIFVMAVNADLIEGPIAWRLAGPGEIEEQGARVLYRASKRGRATVTAYDSNRPDVRATSHLSVLETPPEDLICIRGEFFYVEFIPAGPATRVVSIISAGEKGIHRLHINPAGPGYRAAAKAGELQHLLFMATALEFGRFLVIDRERRHEGIDDRDIPLLAQQIQEEGLRVYSELLEGRK